MKNPTRVEAELIAISKEKDVIKEYNRYWNEITPTKNEDIARRYVFSFLSVHTPWSSNVSSFLLLEKNKDKLNNKEELTAILQQSRAGNYETKSRGIVKFQKDFETNPDFFKLYDGDHQAQRDLIMNQCFGLGLAKTAFALEMCFRLSAQVVCLDTHMLQLYGYTDKKERNKAGSSKRLYHEMEKHWLATCKQLDISPVIARAIWWDKKQQQKNSKYWSYVIE